MSSELERVGPGAYFDVCSGGNQKRYAPVSRHLFATAVDPVAEEVHLVDEQAEKKVEALIKEYEDVFNGMGCLPGV